MTLEEFCLGFPQLHSMYGISGFPSGLPAWSLAGRVGQDKEGALAKHLPLLLGP